MRAIYLFELCELSPGRINSCCINFIALYVAMHKSLEHILNKNCIGLKNSHKLFVRIKMLLYCIQSRGVVITFGFIFFPKND